MISKGLWDQAVQYAERNFALDRFLSYYFGFWEARQYSRILQELQEYQHSADVMRCVFVELLRPASQTLRVFVDSDDLGLLRYAAVRERISRAIAGIDAGNLQAAGTSLSRRSPNRWTSAVVLLPAAAGDQTVGRALFERYQTAMLTQLSVWPDDAMNLNNLA